MRNLKLAVRTLLRTPFVTVVAVLSLALGIGANAAIYSAFHEMLLRSLPVPHPERLVNFAAPGPQDGSNSCNQAGGCDEVFSYRMFRDLEKAPSAFSGIAGHFLFGVNIGLPGQTPINGDGLFVSGSYFPVLGVRPALGRLFTTNDDQTIGGHYLAVLSYGYWQTQLGADPAVLNRLITVNGQQLTIIGVAPADFTGTTLGTRPYVFVPMTMRAVMNPGWKGFDRRTTYWVYVFGRLKPGATLARAHASLDPLYHSILNDVEAPLHTKMSRQTMDRFRAKALVLTDGRKGQSQMIQGSRTPLVLLLSITGIVLLIACANIANLLLARAANRTMEMAVRLSLGATRRQLIAQVLTESLVLAVLGGLLGIGVANLTLGGIMRLLPADVTSTIDFSLSGPVLLFTALLSLGTGIVFGIVPALQSTRPDLVTELRNSSGKLSGSRAAARFRTTLVTVQIGLSMALLISAGLFVKSLHNVSKVDLGMKVDDMATFSIAPARNGYDSTRALALFGRVQQELAAIPGVRAVTSAGIPLLSGSNWGETVSVEGFHKDPDTDAGARFNAVGSNFFHTVGVPILSGRDFTDADNAGSAKVAIVNQTFAKKFHLGANAVGRHMSVGSDSLDITIVGLVRDSKYSEVKDTVPPVFVRPYRQSGAPSTINFYVRGALPAEQLLHALPAAMKRIDPTIPVERLMMMSQQVEENVSMDRMISTLCAAFAVLATILAAIGLYGVLAYSVAQRTREIGVRMALGADPAAMRRMILRQVAVMTLIGGGAGVFAAIGLGRAAQSLLFELQGYDPIVIALSAAALALVALCAGFIPALRASRVDPVQALRYE